MRDRKVYLVPGCFRSGTMTCGYGSQQRTPKEFLKPKQSRTDAGAEGVLGPWLEVGHSDLRLPGGGDGDAPCGVACRLGLQLPLLPRWRLREGIIVLSAKNAWHHASTR